ncbi:hypothetical protein D3C78_1811190 [compost metagenome]
MKPSWSAASSSRPSTGRSYSAISMCPISCITLNSVLATMKRITSGERESTGSAASLPASRASSSADR